LKGHGRKKRILGEGLRKRYKRELGGSLLEKFGGVW